MCAYTSTMFVCFFKIFLLFVCAGFFGIKKGEKIWEATHVSWVSAVDLSTQTTGGTDKKCVLKKKHYI